MASENNDQRVLKVDVLAERIKRLEEECEVMEKKISVIQVDQARYQERVTFYQIGQGGLTLILSTVAAIFGGSR